MSDARNLRGQILQIAELYGLSAECLEDLLEVIQPSDTFHSWTPQEDDGDAEPPALSDVTLRYQELEQLGEGGMGVVHRVFDRHLNRTMARKVLKLSLLDSSQARARFLAEARITAQLSHPGIAPIHDVSELPTRQPYYTMREIRGGTLREAIEAVHAVSSESRWREALSLHGPPWTLRRLLSALRRACEAVAYAHSRGVIHRDIKPDNIMVGPFGEVLVMDWGIARVLDQRRPPFSLNPIVGIDEALDRARSVLGTPSYMPFEQAGGGPVGIRSDVYALGATLYHLLTGHAPYSGSRAEIQRQLLAGPPLPLTERGGPPIPEELAETCRIAMAREPQDRFESAAALAESITAWLEGAREQDRARLIVQQADEMRPEIDQLTGEIRRLRAEADALLDGVRPHEPDERKLPGWRKQDEADLLERRSERMDLEYRETIRSALQYARDLPEAQSRLADHYAVRHAQAEANRNSRRAALTEHLLRRYDQGRYADYLKAEGALTLHTDPPGARVRIYRYELRRRRLVPVYWKVLGQTPLDAVPLPIGSYLLSLHHPDRAPVRYPVLIERQQHWDGIPPGGTAPHSIYLPTRRELSGDEEYIPAGWFHSGGDQDAGRALPRRRLWVDGHVIGRFPITNAEYIAFLDDLVATGRVDEALRYAPRDQPTHGDPEGGLIYGRSRLGRFLLVPDIHGDVWLQDWPVIMMGWAGAVAYCQWRSRRTGLPWRLPGELEWEKAGRGVDGRIYPWGDAFDASWCCTRESHPGRPQPVPVSAFPVDESPYGVRGMAGNTRDWCGDIFSPRGPRLDGDRVVPPSLPRRVDPSTGHTGITRGGAWWYSPREARLTYREVHLPAIRFHPLSFRIARTFPDPSGASPDTEASPRRR
jgi:serine/threonine protein kinase/formylglycine-generating enzyme required for sulfatase activity